MAPDKTLIEHMSLHEKCQWLDALWASIEADAAFQGMPEWHREVIRQRLERMSNEPHPGLSLDELFSKLASRNQ